MSYSERAYSERDSQQSGLAFAIYLLILLAIGAGFACALIAMAGGFK